MVLTSLKETFATISIRPIGTITAPFGEVSVVHKTPHLGIDFACTKGLELTSPFEGIVSSVRDYGNVNLGRSVFIKLENGYQIAFGHLSEIKTKVGQFVHTGDVIGLCGSTGRSTGNHLHFSTFDTVGRAIDPETIWFGYKIGFEYFCNKTIAAFSYFTDASSLISTINI